MNAEGAVTIAEILPESKKLRKLNISQNDVGLAGIMALNLALKMNSTLVFLDVNIDVWGDLSFSSCWCPNSHPFFFFFSFLFFFFLFSSPGSEP